MAGIGVRRRHDASVAAAAPPYSGFKAVICPGSPPGMRSIMRTLGLVRMCAC